MVLPELTVCNLYCDYSTYATQLSSHTTLLHPILHRNTSTLMSLFHVNTVHAGFNLHTLNHEYTK